VARRRSRASNGSQDEVPGQASTRSGLTSPVSSSSMTYHAERGPGAAPGSDGRPIVGRRLAMKGVQLVPPSLDLDHAAQVAAFVFTRHRPAHGWARGPAGDVATRAPPVARS
jgi:hypothetical protein